MEPIELSRWEPSPEDPRRKQYAGQRTAQEVFEELRHGYGSWTRWTAGRSPRRVISPRGRSGWRRRFPRWTAS